VLAVAGAFDQDGRRHMRVFELEPEGGLLALLARLTLDVRSRFGARADVNSVLNLSRTIGNQAMPRLLEANAGDAAGDSTATKTARFGHDFTRIPVSSREPVKAHGKLTVKPPGD